jgi:predicted Rossmann-fold nucleotide-binding protein
LPTATKHTPARATNMLRDRPIPVGGGLGTLSEMAMGLQWNKPVFAMLDAPSVPGAQQFDSDGQLLHAVVQWLLAHEPKATTADLGG